MKVQPPHGLTPLCSVESSGTLCVSLQVPELKMELKVRSLPVSGTKIDLIERLKLYHERSSFKNAVAVETVAENAKLTPPLSPVASKASAVCAGDTGGLSPAGAVSSPQSARLVEKPPETGPCEKDRCLYAKEKQIEELKRKLEQEQRLVKELKLQLEVEKRSQQGEAPRPTAAVKQEEAEEHGRRAPEFVVHTGVRSVQTSGHLPPKTAKLQQQRQRPLRKVRKTERRPHRPPPPPRVCPSSPSAGMFLRLFSITFKCPHWHCMCSPGAGNHKSPLFSALFDRRSAACRTSGCVFHEASAGECISPSAAVITGLALAGEICLRHMRRDRWKVGVHVE